MKKFSLFLIAIFIIGCFAACGGNNGDRVDNVDYDQENQSTSDYLNYDFGFVESDELFDYQVRISETLYQFPIPVTDLLECGWKLGKYEEEGQTLRAGYGNLVWYELPNGVQADFHLLNVDTSEKPISECYAAGFLFEKDKEDFPKVTFAKGIAFDVSTKEDIINAFGEPKNIRESELYTELFYEEDVYKTFCFYISAETGKLYKVDFENNETPEDFKSSGVTGSVPEKVKNYKAPSSLGNEICSGVFKLDGDLYKFPVPLSELLKNGWTLSNEDKDKSIVGGRFESVTLTKGAYELDDFLVYNLSDDEITIENACLTKISTVDINYQYADTNWLVLPGNISMPMTESELLSQISSRDYNTEDSGSHRYYWKEEDGCQVRFSVENGEVSYFAIETDDGYNDELAKRRF